MITLSLTSALGLLVGVMIVSVCCGGLAGRLAARREVTSVRAVDLNGDLSAGRRSLDLFVTELVAEMGEEATGLRERVEKLEADAVRFYQAAGYRDGRN